MIELKQVSKSYDGIEAVKEIDLVIQNQNVFGMLGTNGAGKSTLLRMIAGILKPETGEILIDGEPVWENPKVKSKFFYISDDQFYFANGTPEDMARFYQNYYTDFDEKRFHKFLLRFNLDAHRKIQTFSKGMKKQLSILLGICTNVPYLLCDETFDGLDPVMRQAVKSIFAMEIMNREFTPVIASHNLRELEDICDHVGLLHKGGILFSKDMEEMKETIHKVQCVVSEESKYRLLKNLDVMKTESRGSLLMLTVRGSKADIEEKFQKENPVYFEVLPLSLEEIFISETEVVGYDVKNLLF